MVRGSVTAVLIQLEPNRRVKPILRIGEGPPNLCVQVLVDPSEKGWLRQNQRLQMGMCFCSSLVPGANAIFEIKVNGRLVWSREKDAGFPEIKVLKSLIRDVVAPNKDLGHIDIKLGEWG